MKYYGFVSACYQLPNDFLMPEMMEYVRKDPKFIRVFENTDTGTLRIIANGKIINELASDKNYLASAADVHYDLFSKFMNSLTSQSTLMFIDVSGLSDDPRKAAVLYIKLLNQGHVLEFVCSPWLDSGNFDLVRKSGKMETEDLIREQIRKTLDSIKNRSEVPSIDVKNTALFQMEENSKKNRPESHSE